MGEEERKEEAEKARQAKEDRDSGQQQQQHGNLAAAVTRRPSLQNKGWHCPTCGTGFTTKGNMFKHIRTFHEAQQGQNEQTLPRASLEEEPVTFETFKKYFDRDAVERDPQDFFQSSTSTSAAAGGSSKGNTKTRFTAHQRTVLLEQFHK